MTPGQGWAEQGRAVSQNAGIAGSVSRYFRNGGDNGKCGRAPVLAAVTGNILWSGCRALLGAEGGKNLRHILGVKCDFAAAQKCPKFVGDKTMVALRRR